MLDSAFNHNARNNDIGKIIDTPEGPPDLPRIPGTRQLNTLHALARVTHSLLRCKNPRPLEPQSSGKENLDSGCGNESPTTSATAKMKFTIPFPNDNNATKGVYFLSSSSTPSAMKTAPKKFTIPFHNDNNATKGAYFSSSFSTRRVIPIIEGWSCNKCTLCETRIAKTKTRRQCLLPRPSPDQRRQRRRRGSFPLRTRRTTPPRSNQAGSPRSRYHIATRMTRRSSRASRRRLTLPTATAMSLSWAPRQIPATATELDPEADTLLSEIESEDEEMMV